MYRLALPVLTNTICVQAAIPWFTGVWLKAKWENLLSSLSEQNQEHGWKVYSFTLMKNIDYKQSSHQWHQGCLRRIRLIFEHLLCSLMKAPQQRVTQHLRLCSHVPLYLRFCCICLEQIQKQNAQSLTNSSLSCFTHQTVETRHWMHGRHWKCKWNQMNSKRVQIGSSTGRPNGLPSASICSICRARCSRSSCSFCSLAFESGFISSFIGSSQGSRTRFVKIRGCREDSRSVVENSVDWVPISELSLSSCRTGDMFLLELKPDQQKDEALDFGKKAWKLQSWKWWYFQSASVPACVPCQPPPWHDGLSQQLWFPGQPHFAVRKNQKDPKGSKRQLQSLSKTVILDLFGDETAKTILMIFRH